MKKLIEFIIKGSIASMVVAMWLVAEEYGMEFTEWLFCVPITNIHSSKYG